MKQYQFNEKPTEVPNIGNDISGAKRHNFNTYETPEELRKRAFKKQSTKELKALLVEYQVKFKAALTESTERAKEVLIQYEILKAVKSCELFNGLELNQQVIREAVLAKPHGEDRELMRKKYNLLCRRIRDVKYYRPIELAKYFEPKTKEQFKEVNGHCVPWSTESTKFDVKFLANKVNGVQYGNSLTENERVYVSENLIESIKILEKYLNIDFKTLGFSYGARGKPQSIAHYQDANKVLAFNRGWDGALVHELGHAIDYMLNLVSHNMPYEIRSKYRAKIEKHPILKLNLKYYMNNKEIFARMFEAWVKQTIKESTSFMIFLETDASLPDLDAEAMQWFTNAIQPILKG